MSWWPATPGAPVPDGFEFCDGSAVVTPGSPYLGLAKPDLMTSGRFVRGLAASELSSYGGGQPFHYGGADQVVGHSHSAGDHRHFLAPGGGTLRTTTDGQHSHGDGRTGPEVHDPTSFQTFGELYLIHGNTDHRHSIPEGGAHSHAVDGTQTGEVVGSFSTSSAGSHDNRPSFVSLAYIVRVR